VVNLITRRRFFAARGTNFAIREWQVVLRGDELPDRFGGGLARKKHSFGSIALWFVAAGGTRARVMIVVGGAQVAVGDVCIDLRS